MSSQPPAVVASEIRQQLERILSSRRFVRAESLSRFLRFAVERTLEGNTDQLKEVLLGTVVFDRPADFDPRLDPIVRVQARELRARLAQYYAETAQPGEVVIDLPKGSYVAEFHVPAASADAVIPLSGAPEQVPATGVRAVAARSTHASSKTWLIAVAIVVPLLGAAAWLLLHRDPAPAPMVKSLTTDQGILGEPSFSPDGKQVAYVWDGENHDNLDIYVRMIGSPTALRLTTDPASEFSPKWSPDGRQIAFVRGEQIYSISPLGGSERKIAEVPGIRGRFSWSPDGNWLAVARELHPKEPNGIFLISTDGLQRRRLTTLVQSVERARSQNIEPTFSPDGRRLAYAACREWLCELWLLELAGDLSPKGEPQRLNAGPVGQPSLAWTADSQAVIYDKKSPTWEISIDRLWMISIRPGSEPHPLDYTDRGASHPEISRVGDRLVYDQVNFDFDVWKWKDGRTAAIIESTAWDVNAQYSPDGRKIAFGSTRSGTSEIWVANADGSNSVQLTNASIWSNSPRWSPDGRWIAYDSLDSEGRFNIFVIDAAGGSPRQVTRSYTNFAPSFSRDGKWIYFTSYQSGVAQNYRVPFAGGEPVLMTSKGSIPLESWDGKTLYYIQRAGSSEGGGGALYARDLERGEERQVLDFVFRRNYAIAKEGIYYIGRPTAEQPLILRGLLADRTFPLLLLDPTTSKSRLLDTIRAVENGLSVSPDGTIAYTVTSTGRRADLRLVENFH